MDSSLTDLLHLGVRFYEPGVGRFSQRDPVTDHGISSFIYSSDTPLLAVDPDGKRCRKFHKSPRLQKCWQILDKCAGQFRFYERARRRVGDRIYMCPGNGDHWLNPFDGPSMGSAICWPSFGGWQCKIEFYEATTGDDLCPTLLHELLHCGNWPRSMKEDPVQKAADYIWQYLCDKSSPCYGAPKGKPSDWNQVLGWVVQ